MPAVVGGPSPATGARGSTARLLRGSAVRAAAASTGAEGEAPSSLESRFCAAEEGSGSALRPAGFGGDITNQAAQRGGKRAPAAAEAESAARPTV